MAILRMHMGGNEDGRMEGELEKIGKSLIYVEVEGRPSYWK